MRSTRSDQGIAVLIIFTVTSLAFASILAPSFGCGCSSAENGDEADDDTSTDGDDEDYHPPHEDMIYVSSIAVDESDHAHLVYNSKATRTFRYATNASGTWTKATVSPVDFNLQDGNNGIKIGNDGAAYVYFNDKEAGDPTKPQYVDHYFMKFENSDWSILTSFEGNLISWNNEPANRKFALDSSNRGYLFFSRPRKEFVIVEDGYAEEFTILTLNSDGSLSATALDIDGAGRLYFGYHYDYYVGVSVKDGEAWIEHIAFETGEGSLSKLDMKVDSDSAIHLVIAHDDLLYVTNRTGDWTEETLPESGGRDVELELSSAGEPTVIRSSDRSSGYVTISRRDATAEWTNEKVDAGFGEVVGASAALDSTDAVHISHYMYGGKDGSGDAPLLYTTNASGTWVTEEIDR